MKDSFFELIRLSIGTGTHLSRQPSPKEWEYLYKMALKQSLVGICMAGVKRHMDAHKENGVETNVPKSLFFQWLGMTGRIQEYNKRLSQCCADFEQKLANDGYSSCVLKGQGLAVLYGDLSALRHPGDIDVWALGDDKDLIEWARKTGTLTYYDYHHADLSLYKNAEIELHYRPSLSRNLLRNVRLQQWFKTEGKNQIVFKESLGFSVPDYIFNVVLVLNHNFWHLMYEGVGLRQILDLFFVLRSVEEAGAQAEMLRTEVWALIKHFRLQRFAEASMWIMKEMLGLEDKYLICQPNESAGRFLLEEIMQSGNFGQYDSRLNKDRYHSRIGLMFSWMKHNFRLFKYYPEDVLWTPIGVLRISLWRRFHYMNETDLKG